MKYIISTNLLYLQNINEKINQYMIQNIQGYNGKEWGLLIQHPTLNKYALRIGEDERNPLNSLNQDEINSITTEDLDESWYNIENGTKEFIVIRKT